MAVVDVEGALAAAASKLSEAEGPRQALALVPGLEPENAIEPGFDDLMMHHGVQWPVEKHAGAKTRQRPKAVRRDRTSPQRFEQDLTHLLLLLGFDALQASRGPPHLRKLVGARFDGRASLARQ